MQPSRSSNNDIAGPALTFLRSNKGAMRLAVFAVAASLAAATHAQPDAEAMRKSIVQIVIMGEKGEVRRVGSGFAVAQGGQVLTAAHLVLGERRVVAVPFATGAELVARVVRPDERADLALLAVNGLDLPPLELAKDGFAPGRLVYSGGVWSDSGELLLVASAGVEVPASMAQGAVGKHDEVPAEDALPAVMLIQHNAMIPIPGYGGPLLNECGEVVGINRGAPGVAARKLRRGQAPEGVTHASGATAIVALLQLAGVEFTQSDASCVEARMEAEARAAEAQAKAEEAAVDAEEKGQQLEQRQKELETAAERVSELEEQYEEAVRTGAAEADSLRTNLESARGEREAAQIAVANIEAELATLQAQRIQEAKAERRRLIAIVAVATVLVVLIIVAAIIFHRRRSQELALAQQQAAHAQQEAQWAREETGAADFPDCLLTGETDAGRPVSIKVPGSLLAGKGAVIGRSPRQATFLVDDKTLSREHARLFGADGVLYIEDLATTNGTRVNGRQIPSRTPVPLTEGDALELGAVKVQVAWPG